MGGGVAVVVRGGVVRGGEVGGGVAVVVCGGIVRGGVVGGRRDVT